MLRKPQNLFLPMLPTDLYAIILPNLSFKNLTFFAEAENPAFDDEVRSEAEFTLKKNHPAYTNLTHAKSKRQYTVLIDNLIRRVLPLMSGELKTKIHPKTESTYKKLCLELGSFTGYLIGSHLFSSHAQNEIDPVIIHDLVFHYCQYSQQGAGELLNKNSLRLWNTGNRYLANYLIEYGANVNALAHGSTHSTLFNAATFNSSAEMIRLLIDHGAEYSSYNEIRHGVKYTLMLITALNGNLEALPVLVEKFPNEVNATLETLELMASKNKDDEFTCEFGAYQLCDDHGRITQRFYTVQQITLAKELVLHSISENTQTQKSTATNRSWNPGPSPRYNRQAGQLGLFSPRPALAPTKESSPPGLSHSP